MRRHLLPVSLLLALVSATALTGCSNDSTSGTTKSSASTSPTSSATRTAAQPSGSASPSATSSSPSPSPSSSSSSASSTGASTPPAPPASLPHDRLAAASYHQAYLNRDAASTPEEHAVVDAWMSYWQAVTDTYFNAEPSAKLDAVATGKARSSVLAYLQSQKKKHWRAVGWSEDNVLSVHVTGDTAKVHDCTKNFTFSIDEEGEPATRPDPWYDVTGTLNKQQGSWVVVDQTTKSQKTSCLP